MEEQKHTGNSSTLVEKKYTATTINNQGQTPVTGTGIRMQTSLPSTEVEVLELVMSGEVGSEPLIALAHGDGVEESSSQRSEDGKLPLPSSM